LAGFVRVLSEKNMNCLLKYVNIIKEYALTAGNALGLYLLLEICSISSSSVTKFLYEDVEWLKNQCFALNEQVRFYSAELWSLVLINNIIETQKEKVSDYARLDFDRLFSSLINLDNTILKNVISQKIPFYDSFKFRII